MSFKRYGCHMDAETAFCVIISEYVKEILKLLFIKPIFFTALNLIEFFFSRKKMNRRQLKIQYQKGQSPDLNKRNLK